jgi:hypothetical protein
VIHTAQHSTASREGGLGVMNEARTVEDASTMFCLQAIFVPADPLATSAPRAT